MNGPSVSFQCARRRGIVKVTGNPFKYRYIFNGKEYLPDIKILGTYLKDEADRTYRVFGYSGETKSDWLTAFPNNFNCVIYTLTKEKEDGKNFGGIYMGNGYKLYTPTEKEVKKFEKVIGKVIAEYKDSLHGFTLG